MEPVAETDRQQHRPAWADYVVLQCTRCGNRKRLSWEVFAHASLVIYEDGDMPQRTMIDDCQKPGGMCGRTEVHFVDLDPPRRIVDADSDAQFFRGKRVCGCRQCKSR